METVVATPIPVLRPTTDDPRPTTGNTLTIVAAVVVFALLSGTMAATSTAFLEGDACTHYMFARGALAAPELLVSVWGRPLCTGLYAIPAHLGGRYAVRMTSLAAAISVALVSGSLARWQGWRWPALAVVFAFAQPLLFLHSFSELTELPFATLMAFAFLAYQRRRWLALAIVAGLMPLSRPEGFGFIVLAAVALLLHRQWRWWAVLPLPLIAWSFAGWWIGNRQGHWWHWLIDNWPYAENSLYDRGPLLKFVALMPAVTGPFVWPATVLGIWLCLRVLPWSRPRFIWSAVRQSRFATDHRVRCQVLIAVLPLMVLAGHSYLQWRGKMASNGEVRYMLVVAPFWALLACRGWGWAFEQMRWPDVRLWACLAAVAPVIFNRSYTVLPQFPSQDWVEAADLARWYKDGPWGRQYPHIAVAHPGLSYALDFGPNSPRGIDWTKRTLDAVPAGTIVVWDPIGGQFNSDARRSVPLAELERDGWVRMRTPFDGGAGGWVVFHSPRALPTTDPGGRGPGR